MKRDMDLIRQILLEIEEGRNAFFANEYAANEEEDPKEIRNLKMHIQLLKQAGFITSGMKISGHETVGEITWSGHDLIDTIREPEAWEKTKSMASKAGGAGFAFVAELAKSLAKQKLQELGVPLP